MGTLFASTLAKVQAKIREEGSIRSFAQRLDMNPTTISRWFAEQRSPDFESLCTILEHFNAKIVFPGDGTEDHEGHGAQGQSDAESIAFSQGVKSSKKEIARLTQQLEAMRTERDLARGQVQALKEQLERLVPTEKNVSEESASLSARQAQRSDALDKLPPKPSSSDSLTG